MVGSSGANSNRTVGQRVANCRIRELPDLSKDRYFRNGLRAAAYVLLAHRSDALGRATGE